MHGGPTNFGFLQRREPQLFRLGSLAERYFVDDPNTCQLKLRQMAELLCQLTAARFGIETSATETQADLLRRMKFDRALPREVGDLFHALRISGNRANHEQLDDHASALTSLKVARQLAIWFVRAFYDPALAAGPFVPPQKPADASIELLAELERLRVDADHARSEAEALRQARAAAEQALLSASQLAERERMERETWEALAQEAEESNANLAAQLQAALKAAKSDDAPDPEIVVELARDAADQIDLDEAATRTLIDRQLYDAGWETDTKTLRFANGTRPMKGRNRAIAEWPTATGPADYALFNGLTLMATIEAKRRNRNVMTDLAQAERYAASIHLHDAHIAAGGPWQVFKAPFAFSTNGRPYLKQVAALSGIWRRDVRDADNPAEVISGWPTPGGLIERLEVDKRAATRALATAAFDFDFPIRAYQRKAIEKIEEALARDQRAILVAMATGTGKTKLALAMLYRLIAAKRFRRVCFVVDRSALGRQTEGEFKTTKLVNGKPFADIFGFKGIDDVTPGPDTRVHVCTIQGLVRRILYADDGAAPAIDQYDLIVVDECHRGYLLDREMSEGDMTFRSQADYISKYRRVLDHFDAVTIGLTATPALHTNEIFGKPVFNYAYREAVIDGWLVDHGPPTRIETKLSTGGIHFAREERVDFLHPPSGTIEAATLPDDLDFDVEHFNRGVVTVPFNRAVAEELAKHIDPDDPAKTLIFAVSKIHADTIVDELRAAFRKAYGPMPDATVLRLTGDVEDIGKRILAFRNDPLPKVAVTVDLLTTGIDVPKIANLVFLRRVNSRILYHQMIGRATRRCDEIAKESFRIFDAVDLYPQLESLIDMKPVAADPSFTLTQLLEELAVPGDAEHKDRLRGQIIVRLRRRLGRLTPEARARFEKEAGESPEASLRRLLAGDAAVLAQWAAAHPGIAAILDSTNDDGPRRLMPIATQDDEVTSVTPGYGNGIERPEDFLDAFTRFVRDNVNRIAALTIVVQRPQELTRGELRQLRLELDAAGYTDGKIRRAWADAKNEDIAASIIGYIRQAAIGDPLIPYVDRVRAAVAAIQAQRSWTDVQRTWIRRIGDQLELNLIVDRAAFDAEPLAGQGGWNRIDKAFNGELAGVVRDLNTAIWQRSAA